MLHSHPKMNQEERDKIVEEAMKLFMRFGIKSVSMDDIARDLGMSKKTLYLYINDKEELVNTAVGTFIEGHKLSCDMCLTSGENPVQQMLNLAHQVAITMRDVHSSLIYDLQKYYPQSWKVFEEFRSKHIYEEVMRNMKEGKSTGWYREDLDEMIVARLYIKLIESISDTELFPLSRFRFRDLVHQAMFYHLNGVVSKKGKDYLITHNELLNAI